MSRGVSAPSVPPLADLLMEHIEMVAEKFFQLGDPPDYEQPPERSLAARAREMRFHAKKSTGVRRRYPVGVGDPRHVLAVGAGAG